MPSHLSAPVINQILLSSIIFCLTRKPNTSWMRSTNPSQPDNFDYIEFSRRQSPGGIMLKVVPLQREGPLSRKDRQPTKKDRPWKRSQTMDWRDHNVDQMTRELLIRKTVPRLFSTIWQEHQQILLLMIETVSRFWALAESVLIYLECPSDKTNQMSKGR